MYHDDRHFRGIWGALERRDSINLSVLKKGICCKDVDYCAGRSIVCCFFISHSKISTCSSPLSITCHRPLMSTTLAIETKIYSRYLLSGKKKLWEGKICYKVELKSTLSSIRVEYVLISIAEHCVLACLTKDQSTEKGRMRRALSRCRRCPPGTHHSNSTWRQSGNKNFAPRSNCHSGNRRSSCAARREGSISSPAGGELKRRGWSRGGEEPARVG